MRRAGGPDVTAMREREIMTHTHLDSDRHYTAYRVDHTKFFSSGYQNSFIHESRVLRATKEAPEDEKKSPRSRPLKAIHHNQVASITCFASSATVKPTRLSWNDRTPSGTQKNATRVYSVQCSRLLEGHVLCALIK